MSEDFNSLLGDEADDIQPIKVEARVQLKTSKPDKQTVALRQDQALHFTENEQASDPLANSEMIMVEPLSLLAFQRPGVQHGVYKNLRLGKYSIDATLDLHRMTVDEARQNIYRFVLDCLDNDVRTALITHGKGEGRATPAMLKSCVAHWLPQIDEVLAFHTAQKQHGSYGATYVLLKKSDNKKQLNRERLRK
ncbi:DNA endonuclease SmrA [Agaribacterium sp. ZY112]|uniref:DNA endonuclease SmrA n=1 Tax=Agaribacterium sp. ZY112 TaxID=3233574 RepID=UPI003524F513